MNNTLSNVLSAATATELAPGPNATIGNSANPQQFAAALAHAQKLAALPATELPPGLQKLLTENSGNSDAELAQQVVELLSEGELSEGELSDLTTNPTEQAAPLAALILQEVTRLRQVTDSSTTEGRRDARAAPLTAAPSINTELSLTNTDWDGETDALTALNIKVVNGSDKYAGAEKSAFELAAKASLSAADSTASATTPAASLAMVRGDAAPVAPQVGGGQMPAALSAQITAAFGSDGWQRDFSQQMVSMVARGEQQISLHLNPRELGPLVVNLEIIDNQTHLSFATNHHSVRAAVEQALPQLRDLLNAQGIALADANVSDQSFQQALNQQSGGPGTNGQSSEGQANEDQSGRSGGSIGESAENDRAGAMNNSAMAEQAVSSDGRVNLYI